MKKIFENYRLSFLSPSKPLIIGAVVMGVIFLGISNVDRILSSPPPLAPDTIRKASSSLNTTIVKTYQIKSSGDDAEENKATGGVDTTSWDLQIPYDKSGYKDQIVGLRFTGLDIPKRAVIRSAYLRFFTNNADSTGFVALTIRGEANDNSSPFSSSKNDLSRRPKTTSSVGWMPPPWDESYVSKEAQKSADISSIIREIVSRDGFSAGNALSLFIECADNHIAGSTSSRTSYSYDYVMNSPNNVRMPRLIIAYDGSDSSCVFSPEILKPDNTTYLPDYSYAGYQWGEKPLPAQDVTKDDQGGVVTTVDVTLSPYNATPSDENDDTQAVLNAIADHRNTAGTVVLYFPAGKYIISNVIKIKRGNFVIRGAGSGADGTVFNITVPLAASPHATNSNIEDVIQLYGDYGRDPASSLWPKEGNAPYSLYSWIGGFFYTKYDGDRYGKEPIADIAVGKRGAHTVTVSGQLRPIKAGDVITVEWENPIDNSFVKYLVGNKPVTIGSNNSATRLTFVSQPVTVTAVSGNQITIKEPLMHDVGQPKQTWTARIRTAHFIENVGFENFSVDFPANAPYGGHHLEAGYNALFLTDLNSSWVKDVRINHADSGVIVRYCKNVTLDDIKTTGGRFREAHYDIYLSESYGILVKNFDFRARAVHTPSFNTASILSVFKDGYVDVGGFDQHNGLNHQNLFDNIVVGYTPNLFDHGGSTSTLPTAGMYNTFWNIRVVELPYNNLVGTCSDAPGARIIGLHSPGNKLRINYKPDPHVECLNQCLSVPSLYEHQLTKRLGSDNSLAATRH